MSVQDEDRASMLAELDRLRQRVEQLERELGVGSPAGDALRQSEARYRALVETAQDHIFIVGADGRLEFVNRFASRWLGRPIEQIVGRSVAELFDPEAAQRMWGNVQKVLDGGKAMFVTERISSGGREAWLESWLTPFRDEPGRVTAVVGVARDATAQRQAEERLRQSEEKYRSLLACIPEGVYTFDLQGRFTYVNDVVVERSGRPAEWFIGRHVHDVVDPDAREATDRRLAAAMAGQHVPPYEVHYRNARGDDRWTEINHVALHTGGQTVGVLSVSRDITARRRAEQTVRRQALFLEQARLLQAILDAIPHPVFYKGVDGRYLGCNAAFAAGLGVSPDRVVGKRVHEVAAKELADAFARKDAELLAHPGVQVYEFQKPAADGSARQVIFHKATFGDAQGRLAGLVGTILDITDRKRAEEELRHSEESYRLHFENASDVICALDNELRITRVSPSVFPTIGYRPEELIGRRFDQTGLLVPADLERAVAYALRVLGGEQITTEYTLRHRNGSEIIGEFSAAPLTREGRVVGAIIVARDVTARKQAEERLRESEARYRTLVEQLPAITYTAALDATSTTLYVSPQVEAILGFSPADYAANPDVWVQQLHPDDRERVLAEVAESRSAGKPFAGEYRMFRRDGRVLWFRDEAVIVRDPAGRPLMLQGIMRDVTRRKQTEEDLRRSEARNRAIIHAMPDIMFSFTRDGVYKELISHGAIQMLWPWDAYQGKNLRQILPPELADRAERALAAAFATGQPQVVEYEITDPVIEPRPHREARYVVSGPDEVLCLIRDITDRKRAEERSLAYQQQLRALAAQLSLTEERERRRIAAELHDRIGQALALAKIKLGVVGKLSLPPGGRAGVAEVIRLVEQTIAETRSLTFQLSPPVLYELGFESAVEWQADQIRTQYKVRVDVEDDHQPKPLDDDVRTTMFQAARELLVNAAKHSHAGRIVVLLTRRGDCVCVEVNDDGVGFDLAAARQGPAGFGLFSLRERLEPLGARLEIDTAPGRGCRATLLAPLRSDATRQS